MGEVTITTERYEELLNCEARVEIAVSLLGHDRFMSIEDMLRILGAETEADNLKARENKKYKDLSFEEILEESEGFVNENND